MHMLRRASLVALACVSLPAIAHAQWATTVVPTVEKLPIGSCAAVRLETYLKGTTTVPRTPLGDRVTIKDHDMSMSAPDGKSLAGYWLDSSHWFACGCQKSTIGTKGVITATYPAANLPEKERVPGVAYSVTATVELAKADGTFQPPSCTAALATKLPSPPPSSLPVVTTPGAKAAPTAINTPPVQPVATTPGATPAQTPINAPPRQPVVTTPGPAPAQTPINTPPPQPVVSTPSATPAQMPVNSAPARPEPAGPALGEQPPAGTPVPMAPAGPPPAPAQSDLARPSDLMIQGTPAEVTLSWKGPGTYVVDRWKKSDPACCRATSPVLTTPQWKDPLVWEGTWVYRVVATLSTGTTGFNQREYVYVPGVAPSNVKAEQVGRDSVSLTWSPVAGASHYLVSGPPSNVAVQVDSPKFVGGGVPLGTSTWKVATVYDATSTPGVRQTTDFTSATASLVRRH
jgi:hypothetical protein